MQSDCKFFVPFTQSPDDAEKAYAQLAQICHSATPPDDKRIYAITFKHNGETWNASVGEKLSGTKMHISKTKGVKREYPVTLSDPAVVVAIFPGTPYFVATALEQGAGRSAWENPFMAGTPLSITYFRA